ncbi:hypothetical protein ACTA71_009143 [Dictyostelium dimigraforme]
MSSTINITSDEINFLIYKYLLESGFQHAAFSFYNESLVSKSDINASNVPHGSLVSVLQKGLQYMEVEAHLQEDGTEINCTEPFSLVSNHVCQIKKKNEKNTTIKEKDDSNSTKNNSLNKDKKEKKESTITSTNTTTATTSLSSSRSGYSNDKNDKEKDKYDKDVKMKEEDSIEIPDSQVTTLLGHSNEVFICAWNPSQSLLASGSGDSTARIWKIPPGPCDNKEQVSSIVLAHKNPNYFDKTIDVTTLEWSSDGSLLATGSYDGLGRIWNKNGNLIYVLEQHQAPIFSLKWNKKGNYLLSGSVDKTSIVWDVKTGGVKQQFEFHTAPTLDIDWRNNTQFATCSTDKMIYVCEIGKDKPIMSFQGHHDEINAIKWDPTGNLLASCSDDYTAKIWSMKTGSILFDFKDHTKEIYTIKWSPTGPESMNPNKNLVLASASFDNTIKLWDVDVGKCIYSLKKHLDPVYTVSFSPNGEYLASGSFDKYLHIWSVKDGSLIKSYKGSGGIFEVCWNSSGDKISACYSNSTKEERNSVNRNNNNNNSINGINTINNRNNNNSINNGNDGNNFTILAINLCLTTIISMVLAIIIKFFLWSTTQSILHISTGFKIINNNNNNNNSKAMNQLKKKKLIVDLLSSICSGTTIYQL